MTIELQEILPFVILLCMAVAAMAYKVGFNHGRTEGEAKGLADSRPYWIPRVMQAKRAGVAVGRMLGLRTTGKLSTK